MTPHFTIGQLVITTGRPCYYETDPDSDVYVGLVGKIDRIEASDSDKFPIWIGVDHSGPISGLATITFFAPENIATPFEIAILEARQPE